MAAGQTWLAVGLPIAGLLAVVAASVLVVLHERRQR